MRRRRACLKELTLAGVLSIMIGKETKREDALKKTGGDEMKRLARNMKRSLAFLLAAAMIFTMVPQTGMTAEASEYQTEISTGETV